ncbi:hypothetical protein DPMN_049118 [Dreissena polymorpha]|uniref:Uncharacterized protein n=1 Tax=Dreissena polymorpha TaxID=45954 RepID=A0A9D4DCR3_DREPO|nr:hypothetical protein DPMN_049118 [Dreissena polymorpha]
MAGQLLDKYMDHLEYCIGTGPKIFTLLYKITRDGCNATTFHQKCDNQGPTVRYCTTNRARCMGDMLVPVGIVMEGIFKMLIHFSFNSSIQAVTLIRNIQRQLVLTV